MMLGCDLYAVVEYIIHYNIKVLFYIFSSEKREMREDFFFNSTHNITHKTKNHKQTLATLSISKCNIIINFVCFNENTQQRTNLLIEQRELRMMRVCTNSQYFFL